MKTYDLEDGIWIKMKKTIYQNECVIFYANIVCFDYFDKCLSI